VATLLARPGLFLSNSIWTMMTTLYTVSERRKRTGQICVSKPPQYPAKGAVQVISIREDRRTQYMHIHHPVLLTSLMLHCRWWWEWLLKISADMAAAFVSGDGLSLLHFEQRRIIPELSKLWELDKRLVISRSTTFWIDLEEIHLAQEPASDVVSVQFLCSGTRCALAIK
jgi:hypothetical protein